MKKGKEKRRKLTLKTWEKELGEKNEKGEGKKEEYCIKKGKKALHASFWAINSTNFAGVFRTPYLSGKKI